LAPYLQRAVQVRVLKGVVENQKPECTGSDTRHRWDVLSYCEIYQLQTPKTFAFRSATATIGVEMVGVVITGEALTPMTEAAE
jgi:hypothetical protein